MTSPNRTNTCLSLVVLVLLAQLRALAADFDTCVETASKLDRLEGSVARNRAAAIVATLNSVRNAVAGAQPTRLVDLDSGIKEIIKHPEIMGREGLPQRNLSAGDLVRLDKLLVETTGVKLSPERLTLYGNGIVQEARMAGSHWQERQLYDCQRLTDPTNTTSHGFLGEAVVFDDLTRAYPSKEIQYSKAGSRSTDVSVMRDGKLEMGCQVKTTRTSRGSLNSGLSDAFMAAAANDFKLRQGQLLAIPRDQYLDLRRKGIIEPDGRLTQPEQFAKSFVNEYRQATASGGKLKPATTNDGRLSRIESVHQRPVPEIALDTARNVRVISMSQTYDEVRAMPAALRGAAQSNRRVGGGVSGTSLALNLYFLWNQRGAVTSAFGDLVEAPDSLHNWVSMGSVGSMTSSLGAFVFADAANVVANTSGSSSALRAGGIAQKAGWVMMAGYEAFQVADYMTGGMTQRDFVVSQSAFVCGLGGGLVGAKIGSLAGGAIGTAFGPGPGTAIGSAVGGFAGGLVGGYFSAEMGASLALSYYESLDSQQRIRVSAYVLDYYRERLAR